MLRGETVRVVPRERDGTDGFGMPKWVDGGPIDVENVLVAPGPAADASEDVRPDGVAIRYTLLFPKAYGGPALDNLKIDVRGELLDVVGAPRPYDQDVCPTDWNMEVEVAATDG